VTAADAAPRAFLEAFLLEFDAEMETTRRLIERVPANRLDWKPHARSMSLGVLATHLTELPRWGLRLQGTEWSAGSDKAPPMAAASDYLARFDENVRQSRAAIASLTDDDLAREFTVMRGGQLFFKLKKRAMLRRTLMNHLIHHRGQFTVYLRENDVPLPSVYGPTADEPAT
jgi:uncharacterized damage-inducible protein DinB